MTSLDQLSAGTRARLTGIGGERAFRCRLLELGLLPGSAIEVVRRMDRNGVMEVEVRDCRLSVRQTDAQHVSVEIERPT